MRSDTAEPVAAEELRRFADAALGHARELGVRHAFFRVDRVRKGKLLMRDGVLQGSQDLTDSGMSVRVLCDGTWGFAATADISEQSARDTAARAVAVSLACAGLTRSAVELSDEPAYGEQTWTSAYRINPFDIPIEDRVALMADWSRRLLAADPITHVLAKLTVVEESKFFADLAGTVTHQRRIRTHPQVVAMGTDPRSGVTETLRSAGPPTARGWEYVIGDGWDWDAELAEMPTLVAEKLRARPVEPNHYDLVIDPSQLWLTLHESVGHATELDRTLGHEASYAGTSFLGLDQIGALRYGSPLMHVTADRTAEHGLATTGFDDEGVASQSWDLVEDGILTGFQVDRHTARLAGLPRSNGCAFAESAMHVPLQRMANVSLSPGGDGTRTEDLIASVEDGIYLAGSRSWSIDMQRRNFQFTAQRAHRIRAGRLDGQLSGVAYQASTPDFWAALSALGGAETYQLFGADLCGKGQPVQAGAASHGCPSTLFHGIRVLNTGEGSGL